MEAVPYWSLVSEVLRTGPADGQEILESVRTHGLWEALYLASRSSQYAPAWREAFGRQRLSQAGSNSILNLAVEMLIDAADIRKPDRLPENQRRQKLLLLVRLIANCCVESEHNRRTVIHAGVLLPMLKSLDDGVDPNILVPAIYNVCTDLEDAADLVLSNAPVLDSEVTTSIAATRLARADVERQSVYSGLNILLAPQVVLNTDADILEYLADLVEMAAKPAIAAQTGYAVTGDPGFSQSLHLLLSANGGRWLAQRSAKCGNCVSQALLAVTTSQEARRFLASSGLVLEVLLMANDRGQGDRYLGEDEEERQENLQIWNHIKDSMLRLAYDIGSLPEFIESPKYGIARQALSILQDHHPQNSYSRTVSYIMLYGFVDSDARAILLVNEGLLPSLIRTLDQEEDKTEIYPAIALMGRLAVTWSLRPELYRLGSLSLAQRFLLVANMGFEIPMRAVNFIEAMIKGHPEYVTSTVTRGQVCSIMDDLVTLFDKGNEDICVEIGRLLTEICATLVSYRPDSSTGEAINLDTFAASCPPEKLAQMLLYIINKPPPHRSDVSYRAWYALGLLSTTSNGKRVAISVVQDPGIQNKMQEIEAQGGFLADNVRFLRFHVGNASQQPAEATTKHLEGDMSKLSIS